MWTIYIHAHYILQQIDRHDMTLQWNIIDNSSILQYNGVQQFEKICSAQAWTTKAGTEKSGNLKKN